MHDYREGSTIAALPILHMSKVKISKGVTSL